MMMRALVVEKDGSMNIREVKKPDCGPGEALLKILACGMCGTDLTLIKRSFKGVDSYPLILGHEGVGEVVEIGADVKTFKVGDKVLLPFVDPYPGMGSGFGALSEYGIVHDFAAYPPGKAPEVAYAQTIIPDDLDPVDSILFVTFREVLSTIRYFGVKPEDSIVVFGCGSVGQTFINFFKLLGCKGIVAVDIDNKKLEEAMKRGASSTINANTDDVTAKVRAIYPGGVRHVLDAVGLPYVANKAMEILADRGNVLCYGVLNDPQITIDFSKASYNWNFICQQMPEKKEEGEAHQQIIDWLREGKIVMKDFISDYFKFEDSIEAFEKMQEGKVMRKGIITF